jgi:NAD+ synthetase
MLRIALAQLDPVVGAFEANVKKIKEVYLRACSEQARLLLTPELGICGYPPHDLVERPEMFERNEKALQDLLAFSRGKNCALAVGHIGRTPYEFGRPAQNVATILENGKVVFSQAKTLLPTYDVLDEARYFEPAREIKVWEWEGHRIAVAICEDLWGGSLYLGRRIYDRDPIQIYKDQKAELVLSLSASPYEWGKREKRERIHRDVATQLGVPLIYVNQVGATDEILFDGGSFGYTGDGKLIGRLPVFKPSFGVVSVFASSGPRMETPEPKEREDTSPSEIEVLTRSLVVGVQEYFAKTGFKTALLGLSGGIDSAVVATLAVKALGADRVMGVAMPSQYSSAHSLEDAEILAKNLGIRLEVRPIKFLYSTSSRELSEGRGNLAPIALENLQSRLRGVILMTLSNHYSSLVLTTGNKSELAMGYCTLYGDMAGALAPIGDVLKTRVYELARHMNQVWGQPIPERSITKAPSAELRPNQKDQDTLPPYEILDEILSEYLESGLAADEIEKKMSSRLSEKSKEVVQDILRRLELNEYKRRQAAPVLKVSQKAFGIGRRMPIAKTWTAFD